MATKDATRKGVSKATKKKTRPRTKAIARQVELDPTKPLENFQHERFACEYIKDFNGAQAYTRTYPGVTSDTAKSNAARLMNDARIRARVEHLAREALSGERMNAMQVLQGLARIASLDPRKAFDEAGNLLSIPNMPDDVALAIAGIEITEEFSGRGQDREHVGYTKKLKFNDRLGAFRELGRHFQLFVERQPEPPKPAEQDVTPAQTARLRERLVKLRAPVTIEA